MTWEPERADPALPDEPGDDTTEDGGPNHPDEGPVSTAEPSLDAKPVLEWTKEDWAAWIASPPTSAPPEPEAEGPEAPLRGESAVEAPTAGRVAWSPPPPPEPPEPPPTVDTPSEPRPLDWVGGDWEEEVWATGEHAPAAVNEPPPDVRVRDEVIVDVGLSEEDDLLDTGREGRPSPDGPRLDLFAGDVADVDEPPTETLAAVAPEPAAASTEPVADPWDAADDALAGPGADPPRVDTTVGEEPAVEEPAVDTTVGEEPGDHAWAFGPDRPWWEPPFADPPSPPASMVSHPPTGAVDLTETTTVPPPAGAFPRPVRPEAGAVAQTPPRSTPATARDAVSRPRFDRPAPLAESRPHRVRSAIGLLAVSVLVGLVLAALVTVAVFAIGVAIKRAVG